MLAERLALKSKELHWHHLDLCYSPTPPGDLLVQWIDQVITTWLEMISLPPNNRKPIWSMNQKIRDYHTARELAHISHADLNAFLEVCPGFH